MEQRANNEDDIREKIKCLEEKKMKLEEAIDRNFASQNYQVDNIYGEIHKLDRSIEKLRAQLPTESVNSNYEIDRKAIGIAGGGVNIRAKNDDASKYTFKKRKSFQDLLEEARKKEGRDQVGIGRKR